MTKLVWKYDSRADEERAEYHNFIIRAVRDEHADNPLDDWGDHWPMLVTTDDGGKAYDNVPGPTLIKPLERFADAELVHNQKAIAKILELDWDLITDYLPDADVGEDIPVPRWTSNTYALRELFEDHWTGPSEHKMTRSDLDLLAEFYELLGIPHLRTCSSGYIQRDWAEILVVGTPEAQKQTGAEPTEQSLQDTADLWSAWAWGDVYGYVVCRRVLDEDGEEDLVEVPDGSCWGFYGADHNESGLEEQAIWACDAAVRRALRARQDKLKELIRSGAPLGVRARILTTVMESCYADRCFADA